MATYTANATNGQKTELLSGRSSFREINTVNQSVDRGTILTRKISDTRIFTVTYSVLISLMVSLIIGYSMGYSSPVIRDLQLGGTPGEELKHGYRGIFSVCPPAHHAPFSYTCVPIV